ncbi:preprotein translocase subunit YajC [Boudabousia tangfeifanii]|uniref:Preprotein translocase subunit YajC n=1 Tax=Boudabousia tangfeifanii TaxID=1912795 RepID=A0A1D9MK23_9ACTO|nr:preprotein translocase subunit YajC [Boudabousia tangfeifanii]AOZ72654.1 preprotein translocase subunit YajC [Boudabousia tangfeifanii]
MEFLIFLVPILIFFFVINRSAKKQNQQREEMRQQALVPGNWVLTRAGFYGRIVEIHDEVVILETALGDESVWDKSAIMMAKEPNLAEYLGVETEDSSVSNEVSSDIEPSAVVLTNEEESPKESKEDL